MSEISEPKVIEINVSYHGGGKVAIEDYGGESYDYSAFIGRKYQVPSDWTEEQVEEFELLKVLEIRDNMEPLLQAEHDDLVHQSNAKCHAGK